jgi:hypothetical protein
MVKRKNQKRVAPQRRRTQASRPGRALANSRNPAFGAVSTISTAPVSVGNSMKGVRPVVVQTSRDSVRVVGRDYAYTAYNSGNASGWLLVGGFPLTPACFVSSILRSYVQMYNKFKFNTVGCHYITSSATSSNGDVMFQVNANRTDPIPNWSAENFLPYALSKPETVIGPQWTNHSMFIQPKGPTRSLVPGENNDLDYQSQGEICLYSKTATTDSPGYVLIDYDITFYELSINPKQGLLPNPLMVYFGTQLLFGTTAYTANSTSATTSAGSRGPGNTAVTAITSKTGFRVGDVFKFACDVTTTNMSAYTVTAGTIPTAATLLSQVINGVNTALTIADGYTFYLVAESSSNLTLHANPTQAFTATLRMTAGQTFTAAAYGEAAGVPNAGVWLYGFASYVGSVNPASLQQQ